MIHNYTLLPRKNIPKVKGNRSIKYLLCLYSDLLNLFVARLFIDVLSILAWYNVGWLFVCACVCEKAKVFVV